MMMPGSIQPASSYRVSWPFVLIAGLVGGRAWGLFARVWMRFQHDAFRPLSEPFAWTLRSFFD